MSVEQELAKLNASADEIAEADKRRDIQNSFNAQISALEVLIDRAQRGDYPLPSVIFAEGAAAGFTVKERVRYVQAVSRQTYEAADTFENTLFPPRSVNDIWHIDNAWADGVRYQRWGSLACGRTLSDAKIIWTLKQRIEEISARAPATFIYSHK